MTESEKAEQDVAAARVVERIAEWKAMEAKASYYHYASKAMEASAEVMGARIRRDNAIAAEFADKAFALAETPAPTDARKQDEQDAAGDLADNLSKSNDELLRDIGVDPETGIYTPPPPQEAPAIPEDWTRHDGGECPLRAGVDVDLRFRDGSTYFNSIGLGDFRKNWSWDCSEPAQIVAYRENQASAEAERIEDARDGTPSTEQTEHDRPKLTNEEFESLEKIDGVLDAEPSPILRSEVPPAAETYLAPSGDEFATVNGQTHLIVSDEAEAQGQAETAPQAAYAPIHNEDEPSDAAVFAHGLNVEIDQKADNTNPFNPFRLFGGAKKTLVGEGV